jgi:4-hydroxy-2-oxoheptanedioate aldolase
VSVVRERLAGGSAIGSFVTVPSAMFTEIVALCGFDFVVIDMEHGPIDVSNADDMVRAAQLRGVSPLIRVSANEPHLILRALDLGADGVHVPEINEATGAKLAAESARYGPEGHRGLASVRAAEYGFGGPLDEYAVQANRETLVVAHIESVEAIDNLDELLGIAGIDVYYLGPVDLSNDLGRPGRTGDPEVTTLVDRAIAKIASAGRVAGCIVGGIDDVRRYEALGATYFACHAMRFLVAGSRELVSEVHR